ncbi:MAG: heterodisulfide reductase [Chloroflexi bacterium RBG_13_46_9]|nr:MAG: heterodisulfide reductase [Chloroflexi bacterium RBG_13_46_9]
MRVELSSKRLRSNFVKKVAELSGQNLYLCYQCGKCSAGCPIGFAMDILPNQVIRLIQLGLEEDLVNSKTVWLCASCLTCTARCPRGVDLSRVMEAVRLLTLRKNKNHIEPSKMSHDTIAELPQIAMVSAFRKLTG